MIYRKLNPDEYGLILNMIANFCDETETDGEALRSIISRLRLEKTAVFIAEDAKICGIVGYYSVGDVAITDFFYVLPGYRNGRIGGMLYRTAERYGYKQGLKKCVIAVTEDKEKVYTKIRFKPSKLKLLEKEIRP